MSGRAWVILGVLTGIALGVASPIGVAKGEVVQLLDVHAPDRTVADHPFPLFANVTNHDVVERTVYLFAFLYAPNAGTGPCASTASPPSTSLVQARLVLPAGATRPYPAPGDAWLQSYRASDVPHGDASMELCVFVGEDDAGSATRIRYQDVSMEPLRTRDVDHAPLASFVITTAGSVYRFEASATDADADPVTFAWRLDGPPGPAFGTGASFSRDLVVAGLYNVTLTASDGFESATSTQSLNVAEVSAPPADEHARGVGAPALALTLGALLLALALRPRP